MRSLSLLVALSLLAAACRSTAADESAGGPPLDDAAMMEMMTQLAQPDEHHEVLDVLVGDWDVETRMWMSPDAAPIVEHGTMSANWVLGGRFIEQRFVGSMMGAPFEGLGLMGYDRVREAYVGFWLDSAGTQMLDIATGRSARTVPSSRCTATTCCRAWVRRGCAR
jgi:hypothetical protein